MAYTPTVWANGDVITATKLNKAENGIAAAAAASDALFVLNVDMAADGQSATIDKTLAELSAAFGAAENVFVCSGGFIFVDMHFSQDDEYDGVTLGLPTVVNTNVVITPYDFLDVDGVLTWGSVE